MNKPSPHYKKYLEHHADKNDKLLRERLQLMQQDDEIHLTEWEENFLTIVLEQYHGPLTTKQKHYAAKLLHRTHY